MISLSQEEQNIVQKKRKSERDLPKYYDALQRKEVSITRDFEAFLILAPEELKTNALTWIKKVESLQGVKKDRDDLMKLVIKQEVSNTVKKITTLDAKMDGYNNFKDKFQTMTDFSGINEVNTFLQDLQKVIPELSTDRNRFFFDQTVAAVEDATNKLKGELTADKLTQLQSWSTVISSYI